MATTTKTILIALTLGWMLAGSTGALAGPLAHWQLNETSGSVADDATAPEYDATLGGGASFNTATPGPIGGALYLRAHDGHTFFADSDLKLGGSSGKPEVSFSFWVNSPWDFSNGDGAYQQVIGQHESWSNRISLIHRGSGYLAWDHRGGGVNYRPAGTDVSAYKDMWIHVAATYNAGSYKTYINGEEVFDGSSNILSITAATGDRPFGVADQNPNGRNFVGSTFDDVGVWDSALDAAFVRALYEVGLPESFENLSSSFGFNYDILQVGELFDTHAAAGQVTIAGTTDGWAFVTGLDDAFTGGASPGQLFKNGSVSYLLIDDVADTGMMLIPEPSTVSLLALGILGLGLVGRRQRRTGRQDP